MSSNNPYGAQWDEGGSQPPMPGQGPNVGPGPGQQPSPYRYPQPAFGRIPSAASRRVPAAADGWQPVQRVWVLVRTLRSRRSSKPDGGGGPQPGHTEVRPARTAQHQLGKRRSSRRAERKILIIIGAAALAVILMAVCRGRGNARDTPSADPQAGQNPGQQTNRRALHHRTRHGLLMRSRRTYKPWPPVMRPLPCPTAADPAPTGPLLTNEVLAESRQRTPADRDRCAGRRRSEREVGFRHLHTR